MSTETKVPVVVYAESTPNPSTMKFVANSLIVEYGKSYEYNSPEDAVNSPLAKSLFQFPFVDDVFIMSNFVAIAKTDNIEWEMITHELRDFVKSFLESGKKAVNDDAHEAVQDPSKKNVVPENVGHAEATSEIDEKIIDILDTYVKPAVEQDGGLISFKGFNEGTVTVVLRGACSGCPSSMITLKGGIEQLLKREVPEVQEVVAEEL